MHIRAEGIDALVSRVIKKALVSKTRANPTRGRIYDLNGVLLELKNPRARLSRTDSRGLVFSCLGELLWYLSGRDDLETIRYYIDRYQQESEDGIAVKGAYGPRLYGMRGVDQLSNVISKLTTEPHSRQAVIQLFDAADINNVKSVPCTCVLQFLLRNQQVHLITYMRSNDIFKGLPHDIFCFTMLQEIVARVIGYDVGVYKHVVGSLHLYEDDVERAQNALREEQPDAIAMPAMPLGDPRPALGRVLRIEPVLRAGGAVDFDDLADLDRYWLDLIRLLQVFSYYKTYKMHESSLERKAHIQATKAGIELLQSQVDPIYRMYIEKKQRQIRTGPKQAKQARLEL